MASLKRHRGLAGFITVCAFAVLAACAFRASTQSPQPPQGGARVPVLIELFTSEGCSDCPPADRILEELDTRQSIPGVQAIVLSEHVTYWNRLGWRDPFSLDEVDLRQKEYGDRFNLDSVYTPQAVIDGSTQLVGNNGPGVAKAIEHAAAIPKKPLAIADAHWDSGALGFTVHGAVDSSSKLFAVLAADGTSPKIERGENAGRTLHHVAVVRFMKEFSPTALDGRMLRISAGSFRGDQANTSMRLVVFLVEKKTGRVIAAAEQILSR